MAHMDFRKDTCLKGLERGSWCTDASLKTLAGDEDPGDKLRCDSHGFLSRSGMYSMGVN